MPNAAPSAVNASGKYVSTREAGISRMPGLWKLLHTLIYMVAASRSVESSSDIWPLERPEGMPAIRSLEVMCGKDHMDVHLSFSQPFEGIVSSKGQHADPRCVYVPPSTGQTFFSFRIAYARCVSNVLWNDHVVGDAFRTSYGTTTCSAMHFRCGTKPDMHGQFYENTVVVQYDKDLLEVWDEAKRLRCEWFNDYEKTASKPPMVIADLDVIQLDFRGDNVDCWMEIQHGKGPWAPPVSGIVPLGSTLTLVVAINDYRGEFDMRVKSCAASDGGGHTIQLSDEFGCVLRPKMISRFLKARGSDDRATVIAYAFFHAFKFPDALSVHIKCKVEICRHGCLDHCQSGGSVGHYVQERKDQVRPPYPPSAVHEEESPIYDDVIQNGDGTTSIGGHFLGVEKSSPKAQAQTSDREPAPVNEPQEEDKDEEDLPEPPQVSRYENEDRFPHGPRNLEEDLTSAPVSPVGARRKRSLVVSDRKVRSADVGVSGIYDVISEADLAFSPDAHAEAVTVFQGRIREEIVYGICLPMPGFSALFVIVALSAVVSAMVAGAMLHRLQTQRRVGRGNRKNGTANGWLSYGLSRVRCSERTRGGQSRVQSHHQQMQKPTPSPVEQG
ncbi:uncharacterized protein LOC105704387 isoform X2 [Orussus abietinus]|uniref:uncharacterized protein LOC105704387 isoform X2 n=1 Tax=Orussus abietinus TaxID=222816 RepID=UPI000C715FD7|nr:uncharacterized protein LOC105704387 isoform X2 [Orussus abietinus]